MFWGGGGEGRLCHVGVFGGVSHINDAFRADKIPVSKCNARIHTGFCVGGGEGDMCERWYIGGGHRRAVVRMLD